jgi:hypothetical protein
MLLPAQIARAAAVPATLKDGEYSVDGTLTGGTGKASVEFPMTLRVRDGVITATLRWSSPNFDYMVAGGTRYLPVNAGGNSVFEIPSALDTDMAIIADTTAMSVPHEVAYTLRLDSATLKLISGGSDFPWTYVVAVIPIAIVVACGFWASRHKRNQA